ncbi:predicted protein [Naegleria gruberi]|uniref:Predicted protein n=1 Tax=Naegleria gruberi TaxID=5762 RepID=D2W179_NAEGR|nr:uncharacterized protein NAEGRDRAFT_75121 [Naegleria gruberi]EFC37135.1 predicted protein [Naegleria gruberi]|eukprot:XP_002669879.1 predicted protein [Naegleria gruberi strain NEG-M]
MANSFSFILFAILVLNWALLANCNLTFSQQTFNTLLNSTQTSTLSLTMYMGGGTTIKNSNNSTCGMSVDNPCTNFNQLLLTFNWTLFSQFENFTKATSAGERNVHLKILILPDGSIFCPINPVNLSPSMNYHLEFTKLKLRKLKSKEKAEKQIEEKLLDKRLIFNMNDEEDEYYEGSTPNIERSKSSYGKVSEKELVSSLIDSEKKKSKHSFSFSSSYIIPIEDISIIKKIGEGGAANVYYGTWTNIKVAIKSLKIDSFDDDFENEAAILSLIRHPNILTFYGVCLTDKSRYIVTEYMENGSLDRYIFLNKNRALNIDLFKSNIGILCGIVDGMQYLHSLKPSIIHRDLKSSNILLDERNTPKVSDFGLVKVLGNNTISQITKGIGTVYYLAPETFIAEHQIENKEEATKLDIYSFAIIMWELFFRMSPYHHVKNPFKVPQMVVNGERPQIPFNIENDTEIKEWLSIQALEISSSDNSFINGIKKYFSLILQCWNQNPLQRPTFLTIRRELDEIYNLIG